jgi:tetratricopeptide (TPR) repeat protein
VRELEARAYAALDAGEHDAAEALGGRLLELGWSGGFEVLGLAASGRGDHARACAILRDGVQAVPASAALWHLLGVACSDAGDYEAALEAFERALSSEGANLVAVRFNRAIAHERARVYDRALEDLEPILSLPRPPPFAEEALALAAECLARIGRAEDARVMVQAAYDACAPSDPRRARLSGELALALARASADATAVHPYFEHAAEHGVATPALLALGRKLLGPRTDAPRVYRLALRFAAAAQHGLPAQADALRVFEVAASDLERALELARPYLPAAAREGARIEAHRELEVSGPREEGVHWASDVGAVERD